MSEGVAFAMDIDAGEDVAGRKFASPLYMAVIE
jgi:hypothetical protein